MHYLHILNIDVSRNRSYTYCVLLLYYYSQASVWLSAFLLLLLVMVYGIRTFIFFYRIKTARKSPDRQPLAEMEISQNKAI